MDSSVPISQNIFLFLDYVGVFVFAISGAMMGERRKMDIFGMTLLATATAIGGGTMRDVIINRDVFWLTQPEYLLIILLATAFVFVSSNKNTDQLKWLIWADAVGMSVFTTLGASIAISMGYGFWVSIVMGMMTATFGGLIRDVLANRTPMLLLPQEIYATAAIIGAISYNILLQFTNAEVALIIATLLTFIIRGLAIIGDWKLPSRGA